MKQSFYILLLIFFNLSHQFSFSQEWKNLSTYKKVTGHVKLENGNWLKKDRIKNTVVWSLANQYNLTIENGNLKYQSISEIRDFYSWFDTERKKQGHDVIAFGVAALVAGQLSNFDNFFVRTIVVSNKDVVYFGNEGSKRVLAYFYPLIKEIYFSKKTLKGQAAKDWDIYIGQIEQCEIVEPIYNELPTKAINKLERMAKGKRIYRLKVKKELRYVGDIKDCKARYNHAFTKLYAFYLDQELKFSTVN
jgi:hypothetical protein